MHRVQHDSVARIRQVIYFQQLRFLQLRFSQLRFPQLHFPQLRFLQLRSPQLHSPQLRFLQLRFLQLRFPQLCFRAATLVSFISHYSFFLKSQLPDDFYWSHQRSWTLTLPTACRLPISSLITAAEMFALIFSIT